MDVERKECVVIDDKLGNDDIFDRVDIAPLPDLLATALSDTLLKTRIPFRCQQSIAR